MDKVCFCTLFNHRYLSRGIALYESLMRFLPDSKLYVLAMDTECERRLRELSLNNMIVTSLEQFEDSKMKKARADRNFREYCWTCGSSYILWLLNNYDMDICTYVDADVYFFDNPMLLIEELSDKDVLITPHDFTENVMHLNECGKYCVQFMPFKNNENGRKVLNYWVDCCIDNCRFDVENGVCGDQKYLDDWMQRFECVRESKENGTIGPWCAQWYSLKHENDENVLTDRRDNTAKKLIFYHFHNLKLFNKDVVQLTEAMYHIDENYRKYVYSPYIKKLEDISIRCGLYGVPDMDYNYIQEFRSDDLEHLKKEHNYYRKSELIRG